MKSNSTLICSTVIVALAAANPAFSQVKGGMANAGGHTGSAGNPNTTASNNAMSGKEADWNAENTYWHNNYASRPYYSASRNYSMYEPAYHYGVDLYDRNGGRRYEDIDENQRRTGWNQMRGNSNLNWSEAQDATRDAYNRMYQNNHTAAGSMSPSSGNMNNGVSTTR